MGKSGSLLVANLKDDGPQLEKGFERERQGWKMTKEERKEKLTQDADRETMD